MPHLRGPPHPSVFSMQACPNSFCLSTSRSPEKQATMPRPRARSVRYATTINRCHHARIRPTAVGTYLQQLQQPVHSVFVHGLLYTRRRLQGNAAKYVNDSTQEQQVLTHKYSSQGVPARAPTPGLGPNTQHRQRLGVVVYV